MNDLGFESIYFIVFFKILSVLSIKYISNLVLC